MTHINMNSGSVCEYQIFIEDYINGAPDDLLAETFEAHLPQCASCREMLETTLNSAPAPDWLQLLRQSDRTPLPSQPETGSESTMATNSAPVERNPQITLPPVLPARFQIVRHLGAGGMGGVWEAVDRVLNRTVAIKVLKSSAAIHEQQRMLQEGTALGRLGHPGIVRIYEVILCRDQPAVVMEMVHGPGLDEYVRDQVIPQNEAAFFCMRIAAAAAHAHDNNVIHRDLKPSNILLSPTISDSRADSTTSHSHWQPMISDFGIARLLDETTITHAGQILGTPAYMAPEQTAGLPSAITAAADIYGIGAILYHLLTGRPPFVTDHTSATLALVRDADPLAPHLLRPGISQDLENICLKCLSKSPADRYSTAAALEADLGAFLQGHPVKARPAGLALKTIKWVRRNRLLATFFTATLTLLISIVSLSLLFAREQNKLRSVADEQRRSAEKAYEDSRATTEKLERQLETAVVSRDELMELIGNPNAFRSPLSEDQMRRLNENALNVYRDYIDHFRPGNMTRPRDLHVALRYFSMLLHIDPDKCQPDELERIANTFDSMSPEQLNADGMLDLRCRFLEVSARAAAHRSEFSRAAEYWQQLAGLLAEMAGNSDQPSPLQAVRMRNQSGMLMNAAIELARDRTLPKATESAGEACRILRRVLIAEPHSLIDHVRLLDYTLKHVDFLRQIGDTQAATIAGEAALAFAPVNGYPTPYIQNSVDQLRAQLSATLRITPP
jgi:serine/threonine protein kinase